MAAHLKGLVDGVLKKKAMTPAERHDPHERVEADVQVADSDLFS